MGVTVSESAGGDTVEICPVGNFDSGLSEEFRHLFEKQYPEAKLYRVDLSKVQTMDSAALEMFLILRGHALSNYGLVELYHPTQTVAQLLESSNFNQIFEIIS